MSRSDADVAVELAAAGLLFVERVSGPVSSPLSAGKSAASCERADGRFDAEPEEIVDVDDPGLAGRLNAGWLRMATEYGLFGGHREFMLAVDYREPADVEPDCQWVKVRLHDEWDLAGSGVPAFRSTFAGLFTDRFVPEFTMLSLDGRMLLNTTVWGDGTVSTIVIRPDRTRP